MSGYYCTTPIYYINGLPHIGHVFTTVLTDVVARYHRLLGEDVFFLTGTDEHGQKAEKAARELGIPPREMADRIAAPFQELWRRMRITNNDFIRTTESRHIDGVQEMFRRVQANGDIYHGDYEGWYCTFDESFLTEGQLVDGKCPDCHRPVERIKEGSYFFRLSRYQEPLLEHYRQNPDAILPRSRYNEVISFLESGLRDLSVSRLKLTWGISVPGDPTHVIYVWFDALANYVTAIGFPGKPQLFSRYWPANVHVIGKDILRFHAVYWPAFLLSAGLALPRRFLVHGWWLKEQEKISKSRGNVVEPNQLIEKFGVDGLRYFLIREAPMESDSNYSFETVLKRVNSDLANDLGNLVSRSLTMVQRYSDSIIPEPEAEDPPLFRGLLENIVVSLPGSIEEFAFPRLLTAVWQCVNSINRYIVDQQPWNLAKDASQKKKLDTVLYNNCEALRCIAAIVAPVMPDSADRIWKQLGIPGSASNARIDDLRWGGLKPRTRIGDVEPVFPRIEEKEPEAVARFVEAPVAEPPKKENAFANVTIEDFQKIGLKVGEIKAAEKIQGSKKLLKLSIDLGAELRTVVAGIAEVYSPEELIGRQVIVVTNLKPTRLMGVESNGMVLAASVEGKPILSAVISPVPNGTPVK